MENTNISEIGGIAVAELVKSSFNSISEGVFKAASKLYSTIFEDFKEYMERCYQRNRYIRILCQGDDDVDILDIYVPITFSNKDKCYRDDQMISEIGGGGNYIVTGNGGAGKTFFMRKLWLDLFKEGKRTPLFIELRKLTELDNPNGLTKFNLEKFIRSTVSQNITSEVFEKFCLQGRFVLLLDGFDELPIEHYDEVQKEILNIAEKYPKCSLVTSSRPDTRFSGWASFKRVNANPFTLEQTKELCSKIPFDSEFREKFDKYLTKDFFERHEGFLSNPLLAHMMMMTFRRNMDVPSKISIFYDEAFNTLYQLHDATKAYRRMKNLDILQFRRSFGVFCLLSYMKEKFDFSQTEIEEFINDSNKYIDLDVEIEHVLNDYKRNVNLVMQDGHRYYFVHRSFQEYFAAWALVNVFSTKFSKFAKIIEMRQSDNVIKICYELQRPLVVTDYFLPAFEKFNREIDFGNRLSNVEIWKNYIKGIIIYVDNKVEGNTTPNFPIGLGFSIDRDFENFTHSILKVMDEKNDTSFDLLMHKMLLNDHEFFRMVTRWLNSSNLQIDQGNVLEVSVDFECKLVTFCSLQSVNQTVDENYHSVLARVDLKEEDLSELEISQKEIASALSKMANWCKLEIDSVRKADDNIDKLFL